MPACSPPRQLSRVIPDLPVPERALRETGLVFAIWPKVGPSQSIWSQHELLHGNTATAVPGIELQCRCSSGASQVSYS